MLIKTGEEAMVEEANSGGGYQVNAFYSNWNLILLI